MQATTSNIAAKKPATEPVTKPATEPAASAEPTMSAIEARYMQGEREPATSSVLTSNSKYLNNPYYRDAFVQQCLRRHGPDLPPTYMVPLMMRAISEVTDRAEAARLIAEEKVKNPAFGAWIDNRQRSIFRPEEVRDSRPGTLGAAIRDFMAAGYNMEFIKQREAPSDIDYLRQTRAAFHDIEHLVTGFAANTAGEQALSLCNITTFSRYFTPALAQYLSHANSWVSAGGYMRTSLHYHQVLPTYLEAMQLGIAAGLVLKRPLFMESWGDYLDWSLEDIAKHIGFVRGPGDAWAWTTEAASG
jgi:ubiquinone biosynthesis protein COQ4